ncbi:folate/biopterin family MFS transporter [Lyngbya sp. CCY1209]|uniref:folate/biopterin family MFS transporter n=1 Tax=Lyngbya sp. CCY1209 TaxID=2886103 RepID=UPI002D2151E8|nr:folate/biopterin family MFS transporter [Lyngbya sp. CCY1209]MEB3883452.1 folate/biopterin family MFS transporter [Lyngbya sp. CCY1209]
MRSSRFGTAEIKAFIKENIFFGNDPSPELVAILTVYFVQGILGLARLAVSFFLKDDLGMSPAETAALTGIASLPWVVKPLFGFLSDGLPIFGYRRRPYLILSGLLGALSWVAMATVVSNPVTAGIAIALSSLSVAVSDVIVDSLVVERARNESIGNIGSLQSLCWATSAIGGLITAYLSGYLLEAFNSQTVFLITATFPLLVSAIAGAIAENRITDASNWEIVKDQVRQLRGAITQKSIWLPTAFVFLWQATPSGDSAFFYFSTNELGFQPEFLGRVRLVTSIAALIGIWLFQRFFKSVPFRKIFLGSTIISAVLGMSVLLLVTHANRALGIDDRWFSLGDSLILTVAGEIAYMPVLVLAARLCPPGVEATLFALLMSISNLARLLSHESGALLTHLLGVTETNFDNLWLLLTITNLSTLLPLPLIHWLPQVSARGEEESPESPDGEPESLNPELVPELVSD